MALSLDDIERLFSRKGELMYTGEPVTQLEHALQTAWLAEESGADDALVTACLLHDLGHMLNEQGDTPTLRGLDDAHQYVVLPFLRGLFPDRVLDVIKLHVDAKRYLCCVNLDYWAGLSADSKRSLELQGGIYDRAQCAAFISQTAAIDAVKLRRWDDEAKQPDTSTPALAHFLERAARCCAAPSAQQGDEHMLSCVKAAPA
jgi:phosphonate degradation associated HDIG domain protein